MRQACTKYALRIKVGMDLKNYNSIWVVMGKTSEWTDEDLPDSPSPGEDEVVEPFLAIKPSIISMAREITYEEFSELSQGYRAAISIDGSLMYLELVSDVDAQSNVAKYLYISALYDPIVEGHPNFSSCRSYWLCINLVPSSGYDTYLWLTPEHIDDYGLVGYENSGTKMVGGTQISLPVILELR